MALAADATQCGSCGPNSLISPVFSARKTNILEPTMIPPLGWSTLPDYVFGIARDQKYIAEDNFAGLAPPRHEWTLEVPELKVYPLL